MSTTLRFEVRCPWCGAVSLKLWDDLGDEAMCDECGRELGELVHVSELGARVEKIG